MHAKMLHKVLFFLFSILSLTSTAQVQKGAKTIGSGLFQLRFNSSATEDITKKRSDFSTDISLGRINVMLTDRLQVGSDIGFSFSNSKFTLTDSSQTKNFDVNIQRADISISPRIAYFFSKNRDFFVAFDSDLSLDILPDADFYSSFRATLGYVKSFPENPSIFWNAQASYRFGGNNNRAASINLGMTHFIPALFAKSQETPQYLTPGRSIISAGAAVEAYFSGQTSFLTNAYFQKLTFRNNQFAFGGYGGFSWQQSNGIGISGGAVARYYIPISKRLFIYPNLGLGVSGNFNRYSGNGIKSKSNNIYFDFNRSVGFNYFLSPDLALDFNVDLRFNNDSRSDEGAILTNVQATSFNANVSFGVTYFVDKIFKK